jgi:nucleoside-diphosphate-sugar epimerase
VNVFVAGATGAIGRRLTPLLTEAGYTVDAFTRDPEKARALEAAGVRASVGDVFDAAALRAAMARVQPALVAHQLTDLPQSRDERGDPAALARNARIRVEGTRNLIDAALACGAQRILAQSIAFAYAAGPEPHAEGDPLDADTRSSVITLERLVLASPPLIGTVLRYGSLYGPGTWFDEPSGNVPVHVDAAALATLLAITRVATGVFNVAEERGYADCSRARTELGWDPDARLPPG